MKNRNRNEKNSITIREFYEAFPDDDACIQHVFDSRFGQGHVCPKCAKKSNWSRMTKVRAYACQWCGHHIHPTAGTLFEDSRTPMQLWFYAIYLFTTSRHGVPAMELMRKLGVTYKCAFRMGHKIREHMEQVDGEFPLFGDVEIDETYVGGRTHGEVMTKVVPNVAGKTLKPIIEENVTQGSTVHTDELRSYKGLAKKGFAHKTVNHGAGEYASGDTHVNNLENFWKHLKGGIRGTHIHVSKQYLHNYAKEFEFRFNRRLNPSAMFPALVSQFPKP
jgi:transposase-like protein